MARCNSLRNLKMKEDEGIAELVRDSVIAGPIAAGDPCAENVLFSLNDGRELFKGSDNEVKIARKQAAMEPTARHGSLVARRGSVPGHWVCTGCEPQYESRGRRCRWRIYFFGLRSVPAECIISWRICCESSISRSSRASRAVLGLARRALAGSKTLGSEARTL